MHGAVIRPPLRGRSRRSWTGTTRSSPRAGSRAAGAVRPQRPHHRQRAGRRRRADHRHHRLRRPEPHRAGRRPGVGARLAGARGGRARRDVPGGAAGAGRLPAGRPAGERELGCMGELWATRAAVGVAIGSWRAGEGLEEPEFAERTQPTAAVDDRTTCSRPAGTRRRAARGARPAGPRGRLSAARRDASSGRPWSRSSYAEPIEHGQRERRLDDRHRRAALPRHVQQRRLRGALPSAGARRRWPASGGC